MPTTQRFDCFEVDLSAGHLFGRGTRIHSYVFFDLIRADPRFHALLRTMKLDG
jgi:hypothetical protein